VTTAKWPRGVGHYLSGDATGAEGVWMWVDQPPFDFLDFPPPPPLPLPLLFKYFSLAHLRSEPHTDNDVNEVPQLLPQKFSSACHVALQNVPINVSRLQFNHPSQAPLTFHPLPGQQQNEIHRNGMENWDTL